MLAVAFLACHPGMQPRYPHSLLLCQLLYLFFRSSVRCSSNLFSGACVPETAFFQLAALPCLFKSLVN